MSELKNEFLELLSTHCDEILIKGFFKTVSKYDLPDYRINKDLFLKDTFARILPNTKSIDGQSYDLLYKDKYRISIKMQNVAFQRLNKINYILTKPKALQIYNTQSCISKFKAAERFDLLVVCQPGSMKQNLPFAMGAVDSTVVQEFCNQQFSKRSDQLQIAIPNEVYVNRGFLKRLPMVADLDKSLSERIISHYDQMRMDELHRVSELVYQTYSKDLKNFVV